MQVRRLRIGQRIFEPMDIQRVARIVDSSSEFRRRGSSMKNIPTENYYIFRLIIPTLILILSFFTFFIIKIERFKN